MSGFEGLGFRDVEGSGLRELPANHWLFMRVFALSYEGLGFRVVPNAGLRLRDS